MSKEYTDWKDGYAIAEWLLAHKTGLEKVINDRYMPTDIFDGKEPLEAYTDGVLDIIKDEIKHSLSLDPETISLTLTPTFITMIYGDQFFRRSSKTS